MNLHLELTVPTAVEPTANVLRVAAMFGLGVDQQRPYRLVPPIDLELIGGQIVFVTGPSGSGKSTILRLIAQALSNQSGVNPGVNPGVIRFDQLPDPPDRPLVDGFPDLPLDAVTALLSLAGLNDAFVMLRRPAELSDGQRYRLRLAQAIAAADANCPVSNVPCPKSEDIGHGTLDIGLRVVLADEFGATLDRLTAAVIARNVRKWVRRSLHACFVAATTHDDLLEPLEPDVLIEKRLGDEMEVVYRAPSRI